MSSSSSRPSPAGWNAQLDEVGADGLQGWCAGEEWVRPLEPVEVYAYARSIALQASSGAVSDFIASAQPPDAVATTTTSADEAASAPIVPAAQDVGSNGWAIGAERSADGGGMLVANPHFPWEGELRFWEVHLTIPGELDVYGVQLSGLPGIGIGFTENFGWTHTVSAGNRFTAYRLELVPGSPTTYVYGDDQREMTSQDVTVEVRGDDGRLSDVTRTMWSSHYGPIIDFPGFGWTEAATITYRDANIDNDEFIDQYLGMVQADDLDEFIEVHREVNGVPLFNTIAVSDDGRAWYADTSATPNLSDEAIAAYQASLESDPIVGIAAENGAVLLDGSDPVYEWVDEAGARDPGLVPAADQPMVERDDYVFNANDSFWLPHATEMLEGDYSPLHGAQRTARSPRTRENAVVLGDTTTAGPAGEDGAFTLDELAAATVQNRGYTSRVLLESVVERCRGAATVDVPAQEPPAGGDGPAPLPAASVDVGAACAVLAGWDGVYDVDRAGPPLWRELLAGVDSADLTRAGALWAEPFEPERPVDTPAGLAPAPGGGAPDPVLVNLARAVQSLEAAGFAVDATLGEVQFALRDGQRIPIHGGNARDGTTNVVGWGTGSSILDPTLVGTERQTLVPGSSLARASAARPATRSTTARRSSWRCRSPATDRRPGCFSRTARPRTGRATSTRRPPKPSRARSGATSPSPTRRSRPTWSTPSRCGAERSVPAARLADEAGDAQGHEQGPRDDQPHAEHQTVGDRGGAEADGEGPHAGVRQVVGGPLRLRGGGAPPRDRVSAGSTGGVRARSHR